MYENELYHYGVKGMRWGHRKAQPVSGSRGRIHSTKSKYKQEKKAYKQTDEYKAKRAKYIKTGAAVVAVAGTIAVASLAKKEMRKYVNGGARWLDNNAPRLDYAITRNKLADRSMRSTKDLIKSTRDVHKALNDYGVDVSRLKRTGHWG